MRFLELTRIVVLFIVGTSLRPSVAESQAPPPAEPPTIVDQSTVGPIHPSAPVTAAALPLYSIGQPTDDEQGYLELINRARANPAAEADRLRATTDPLVLGAYNQFGVDLNLMKTLFVAIPPQPPLSMNANLMAAARAHSLDMQQHQVQSHTGSDGSTTLTRTRAAGYNPVIVGENIYAFAEYVFHGHAGFEVDWGDSNAIGGGVLSIVGGMQTPAGHRGNIHSGSYKEVGIGVLNTNQTVTGPQLVTQDFGSQAGGGAFITGVVYYDLNQNQFYDAGEGIGGALVEVAGAAFSAVTASSGGYSVPISANGTYTVTISVPGAAPVTRTATISNSENVKLDYLLSYAAPVVSGSATPGIGVGNAYQISPIPGATSYEWVSSETLSAAPLGAEDGLASVNPSISTNYSLIATDVKSAGTSSYHLLTPKPKPESFDLKPNYICNANATISFASRLAAAARDQIAKVQVSSDNGATWTTVMSQAGVFEQATQNLGETTFSRKSISLAQFSGQTLRFRFLFDFQSGSFLPNIGSIFGWYIDDIQFTNLDILKNEVSGSTANPVFSFTPASAAKYLLRARPIVGGHTLPYGPVLAVSPTTAVAAVTKLKSIALAAGDVRLAFDVISGAGSSFAVESAPSVKGPWTAEASPQIQAVSSSSFTAVVRQRTGAAQFYRVRSN